MDPIHIIQWLAKAYVDEHGGIIHVSRSSLASLYKNRELVVNELHVKNPNIVTVRLK